MKLNKFQHEQYAEFGFDIVLSNFDHTDAESGCNLIPEFTDDSVVDSEDREAIINLVRKRSH